MSDAVHIYECGNFESIHSDPPDTCPYCDAEKKNREEIDPFQTVSVTCPGWDHNND